MRLSVSWGLFITLLLSIPNNRCHWVMRIHLWPGALRLGGFREPPTALTAKRSRMMNSTSDKGSADPEEHAVTGHTV